MFFVMSDGVCGGDDNDDDIVIDGMCVCVCSGVGVGCTGMWGNVVSPFCSNRTCCYVCVK